MEINPENLDQFFEFTDSLDPILLKYANVIVFPSKVQTEEELLRIYANIIPGITGYFGENWNALDEIVRDFHWLDEQQKNIVIFHQDIPISTDKENLLIYLSCLALGVSFWREPENPERSLKVVFPVTAREKILEILLG